MTRAKINGACLSGKTSRVEIQAHECCALFVHSATGSAQQLCLDIAELHVENHLVSLGTKPCLTVVEHLFSALYGMNLFTVRIDVFGNEIPFLDGSSKEFVAVLQGMQGSTTPDILRLNRHLSVRQGESFIEYEPDINDKLIIDMILSHPYIGTQQFALEINENNYKNEIAPARTFVFTDEDDPRLKNLPPYGIGITKDHSYAAEPLRFPDEPVRHKILDLLGDLFVVQKRLTGRLWCKNTSHLLNLEFVKRSMLNLYN